MPSDVSSQPHPPRPHSHAPRAPDPAGAPGILEWYRWDQSRPICTTLLRGAVLTVAGALWVSHAIGPWEESGGWMLAGLVGLVLTASGPLSVIAGLRRILDEDDYIALRRDGLVIHTCEHQVLLSWNELDTVQVSEQGRSLCLTRRDGTAFHIASRFAGIDAERLAQRIDEVKRKAQWNLLHTL